MVVEVLALKLYLLLFTSKVCIIYLKDDVTTLKIMKHIKEGLFSVFFHLYYERYCMYGSMVVEEEE